MKEKFAVANFQDFYEIEELSRSNSGVVYKAKYKYDRKIYLIKERRLSELGRNKDIMNEVKLLIQLDHNNVVKCEGFFRDDGNKGKNREVFGNGSNSNSVYMVLEYCEGGDLYKMISKRRKTLNYFEESEVWNIFHQICNGLKHLHEHGIIHRDLKSLNIMVNKDQTCFKIGDLGVSRQVSEDTIMLNTFYGTPLYLSPELVENKPYNEKTDIWSLGVILYEIACLTMPFNASTVLGVAKLVLDGQYNPLPNHYSYGLSRCIRWMLSQDQTKRPNIAQVLEYTKNQMDHLSKGSLSPLTQNHAKNQNREDISDDDSLTKGKKPGQSNRYGQDDDTASEGSLDRIKRKESQHTSKPDRVAVDFEDKTKKWAIPGEFMNGNATGIEVKKDSDDGMRREGDQKRMDDVKIDLDLNHIQTMLRRDSRHLRKLLQMREFNIQPDREVVAVGGEEMALSSIDKCRYRIKLFEKCLDKQSGSIPQSEIIRLDITVPSQDTPSESRNPAVPRKVSSHVQEIPKTRVYMMDPTVPEGMRVVPGNPPPRGKSKEQVNDDRNQYRIVPSRDERKEQERPSANNAVDYLKEPQQKNMKHIVFQNNSELYAMNKERDRMIQSEEKRKEEDRVVVAPGGVQEEGVRGIVRSRPQSAAVNGVGRRNGLNRQDLYESDGNGLMLPSMYPSSSSSSSSASRPRSALRRVESKDGRDGVDRKGSQEGSSSRSSGVEAKFNRLSHDVNGGGNMAMLLGGEERYSEKKQPNEEEIRPKRNGLKSAGYQEKVLMRRMNQQNFPLSIN